jgi:MOSC domain-containing protein YiiM
VKVLSINVGKPKTVDYEGRRVRTAIWKYPVAGAIAVNEFNLEGDAQADLRVHGGISKSVYVYPSEHYEYWKNELPDLDLPWGVFGENLTTVGLLESEVRKRDRLRVGTAEFAVTVPRYPCYKLGIRFGSTGMLRRFAQSGRSGFYLTVLQTGSLSAGDEIGFEGSNEGKTIADVFAEKMIRDSLKSL